MLDMKKMSKNYRLLLILFLSFFSLSVSLVSEHAFYIQPCAWCIMQRFIFLIIAFVTISGFFRKTFDFLISFILLGLSFLGIVSALKQYVAKEYSISCDMTLVEQIIGFLKLDLLLPKFFRISALCSDEVATFLGIDYSIWNFFIFSSITICSFSKPNLKYFS